MGRQVRSCLPWIPDIRRRLNPQQMVLSRVSDLQIGQDVSIGYLSHTDDTATLYLQESFTFLLLTAEAAVALLRREDSQKN